MSSDKTVVIREQLAGALLTLIKLGTFPFQHGQIVEIENELLAAVSATGIGVEVVPDDVAKADVVKEFEGGLI